MENVNQFIARASEMASNFCKEVVYDIWHWFTLLNREEWIVVLAIGASCGFLCMRGFGSRSKF